jgi:hypothetical protein
VDDGTDVAVATEVLDAAGVSVAAESTGVLVGLRVVVAVGPLLGAVVVSGVGVNTPSIAVGVAAGALDALRTRPTTPTTNNATRSMLARISTPTMIGRPFLFEPGIRLNIRSLLRPTAPAPDSLLEQ